MSERAYDSPAAACDALIPRVRTLETERIRLEHAAGRILAAPLRADRDSPASDVSAMDGYAVRVEDLRAGRLPVDAETVMGEAPPSLRPGAAVRITTGAGVPPQADAVLKREDVDESSPGEIVFGRALAERTERGQFIRRAAENLRAGDEVVPAGATITPGVAAALATFGNAHPLVRARLRVAILMTGDEVLPADAAPGPWQIRDSHRPALLAMLAPCPWLEVVGSRHVPDEPRTILDAILAALPGVDALMLTGGISVGPRDFVRPALERAGAEIVFHRIPQRPGKPVLGAAGPEGQCVLALPGNPVSVMVTARRIGATVLGAMARRLPPEPACVRIADPDDQTLDLWWHRLVRLRDDGTASLVRTRGSGDVASAARADGFIEVPPSRRVDAHGASFPLRLWHWD